MYYYSIVILILAIINLILVPTITSSKIEEVDYSTFMQMTEEKQIDETKNTFELRTFIPDLYKKMVSQDKKDLDENAD